LIRRTHGLGIQLYVTEAGYPLEFLNSAFIIILDPINLLARGRALEFFV
jgi:hypothetical protein